MQIENIVFDLHRFGFDALLGGPGGLVLGTDTGVGKTVVACRIAAAAREAGRRVGVMKPFATGAEPDADGRLVPKDTQLLLEAAGGGDPEEATPVAFGTPCAPPIAAAREGRPVDLDAVRAAYARIRERSDFVVVEGIGGVLCPVTDDTVLADLVGEFGLPTVLVVPVRLGMIGQALLSVEALRSRGIEPAGVVWNHVRPDPNPTAREDRDWILRRTGLPVLAEVPFRPHAAGGAASGRS